MRAYYFDNLLGDQRLQHDSGNSTDLAYLRGLGVLHWTVPLDNPGGWEIEIDRIAEQHNYKNRDIINISKEGLGDLYESKLRSFFEEHMHEDDEIRFILSGSGFFDVRDHPSNEWIRIHVLPGDLLVIPAGIYHRFTLDESDQIKALRLFKEEPKWTPYSRSPQTDCNVYRVRYINSLKDAAVV
ncbi:Acireductone dioxygenase [Russula dissimulans]|nr:Acireductone dioxygenase [Russula dissimulans]